MNDIHNAINPENLPEIVRRLEEIRPIRNAINTRNIPELRRRLNEIGPLADWQLETLLDTAIEMGDVRMAEILVNAGADAQEGFYYTLRRMRFRDPVRTKLVRMFLRNGAQPFADFEDVLTPILRVNNDLPLVKMLLEHGAYPSSRAILAAIDLKDNDILNLLIDYGMNYDIDLNERVPESPLSPETTTFLEYALRLKNVGNILRTLVQRGAVPTATQLKSRRIKEAFLSANVESDAYNDLCERALFLYDTKHLPVESIFTILELEGYVPADIEFVLNQLKNTTACSGRSKKECYTSPYCHYDKKTRKCTEKSESRSIASPPVKCRKKRKKECIASPDCTWKVGKGCFRSP